MVIRRSSSRLLDWLLRLDAGSRDMVVSSSDMALSMGKGPGWGRWGEFGFKELWLSALLLLGAWAIGVGP